MATREEALEVLRAKPAAKLGRGPVLTFFGIVIFVSLLQALVIGATGADGRIAMATSNEGRAAAFVDKANEVDDLTQSDILLAAALEVACDGQDGPRDVRVDFAAETVDIVDLGASHAGELLGVCDP